MAGGREPGYQPSLSAAELERVRAWHERSYEYSRQRREETFEYLGLTLVVPPSVQPITPTSHLLGEAVIAETRPGDRVLDMGTGCGVNAILAARQGANVVAVDLNKRAVSAARANAERNGVADRVDVRESDVFAAAPESYDLIVFDPPFRWFKPRDDAELATADENYRALTTFFREVRDHLTVGGRILLFFGSSGDLAYFQQLVAASQLETTVVARLTGEREGIPVEYLTYKLVWPARDA